MSTNYRGPSEQKIHQEVGDLALRSTQVLIEVRMCKLDGDRVQTTVVPGQPRDQGCQPKDARDSTGISVAERPRVQPLSSRFAEAFEKRH